LANDGGEGGEFTPDIIRSLVEQWGADRSKCLQIKPRDFQKTAIQLGLADAPTIDTELEQIAENIWQWFQESSLGVYKGVV